jgi:hypothetical protein
LVATVDKVSRLWLRPMDSETMTPLAGTEGARFPFWSPDGRSIGFFAHAKLKAIDVISGAVEVLAYAPDPHGGTWNRDDVILFVPRAGPPLQRIQAREGRAATEQSSSDGDRRFRNFSVLLNWRPVP